MPPCASRCPLRRQRGCRRKGPSRSAHAESTWPSHRPNSPKPEPLPSTKPPGARARLRRRRCRRRRTPRRLRRQGAQRQDRRRVRRRAGCARRRPQGGRIGLHRHVARLHPRRRRASAQRRDHLRQVPRSCPSLQGARHDPAHRTAARPGAQGPEMDAAQGSWPSRSRSAGRPRLAPGQPRGERTARARMYREQLREILDRKQIPEAGACSTNGTPA